MLYSFVLASGAESKWDYDLILRSRSKLTLTTRRMSSRSCWTWTWCTTSRIDKGSDVAIVAQYRIWPCGISIVDESDGMMSSKLLSSFDGSPISISNFLLLLPCLLQDGPHLLCLRYLCDSMNWWLKERERDVHFTTPSNVPSRSTPLKKS